MYPMGSEKQMIQVLTGQEVPAGGRAADIGVLVHNVGTAYAVQQALCLGRPLVSRIVTVSGGAIMAPGNLEAPIGALAADLVRACGGLRIDAARLVLGGPMMGTQLSSLDVPLVKGSSGVLALTRAEVEHTRPGPCIRCSSCVRACPMGLLPLEMAARIRVGDPAGAVDWGLKDCIACGSCSYVCPSHIPLVHYFNHAKGDLAARERLKMKNEATKKLADERSERMARIVREREEAARQRAAKKAAADAAKKAAAEAVAAAAKQKPEEVTA
jgi:electron transport complex protein RnfC